MKKLLAVALIAMFGATLFTSCSKEDEVPAPTISVTNNKTVYTVSGTQDTTIAFNVVVKAEGEISSFTIKKTVGSQTTSWGNPQNFSGKTDYTFHFEETFHPTDTYPISFTFKVVDKKDQEASITVTIQKINAPQQTPFETEYTDGVFYHIYGPSHGAYDLDNHTTVGISGPAASKSMVNTDAAGATFTGSWRSTDENGTTYVKTTTAYNNIYKENVATLYNNGTPSQAVNNPQANDVYIGKKGTKYYVIQILSVEPNYDPTGGAGNKGRITFKYKM
jgi:hypothetical protein